MNRTLKHSWPLFAVTIALSLIASPALAWENQTNNLDPENDGRPQVIARSGGFPSLNPRTPSSDRPDARQGTAATPVYRVQDTDSATSDSYGLNTTDDIAFDPVDLDATPASSRSKMIGPLVTVASSLSIVLALFCALVWAGRKFGGGAAASKPLPASALTPLGHVMLDPRTKLLLVKCGRRILVLSQTAGGITPITEVTNPDEVRELIANCSSEAREVFERTLREIELEPVKGFTDSPPTPPPSARQSGRLFATA